MLGATRRDKLAAACGQAIQSLAESAEPATTSLWRALRTLVGAGDPHYPVELAGRLPLQAASNLDPVRMQLRFRRYLIEGHRPAGT